MKGQLDSWKKNDKNIVVATITSSKLHQHTLLIKMGFFLAFKFTSFSIYEKNYLIPAKQTIRQPITRQLLDNYSTIYDFYEIVSFKFKNLFKGFFISELIGL